MRIDTLIQADSVQEVMHLSSFLRLKYALCLFFRHVQRMHQLHDASFRCRIHEVG